MFCRRITLLGLVVLMAAFVPACSSSNDELPTTDTDSPSIDTEADGKSGPPGMSLCGNKLCEDGEDSTNCPLDCPDCGENNNYDYSNPPMVYENSVDECMPLCDEGDCDSLCDESFKKYCDTDEDGKVDDDKKGAPVTLCYSEMPCNENGGGTPAQCDCGGMDDPKTLKNCCCCVYMDKADCHGPSTKTACLAAHNDCRWVSGVCVDRHHQECWDWLDDSSTGCDIKKVEPLPWPPSTSSAPDFLCGIDAEKEQCTSFMTDYDGHGLGCGPGSPLDTFITVCWPQLTCCDSVTLIDEGCATINPWDGNLADFQDFVQTKVIEAHCAPNMMPTLTVYANQVNSSDSCQNFVTFTLDVNAVCPTVQFPECEDGGPCFKAKQWEECSITTGDMVESHTQTCCNKVWRLDMPMDTKGVCP